MPTTIIAAPQQRQVKIGCAGSFDPAVGSGSTI
ncbi:hypothetical protein AAKU58_004230, partial [Oxalobacteraceae bacterium GrIS 1.18]